MDAFVKQDDLEGLTDFVGRMPWSKKKALLIAVSLHQGQKDRGGKPYIEHLQYVAENSCTIRKSIFLTESSPTQIVDQYAVGVLHDSLEDVTIIMRTGSTHDRKKEFLPLNAKHLIKMGVPDRVVRAIELLTKNKNEVNLSREVDKSTPESSWEAYKPQIMPLLAPDSDVPRESQILGICAKIADNRHNADFTRLPRKAHFLPSTMIRCATYGMSAAALICRAYELEREPIN